MTKSADSYKQASSEGREGVVLVTIFLPANFMKWSSHVNFSPFTIRLAAIAERVSA
jgi:hypothetical protein